jgi:hypothetical protein
VLNYLFDTHTHIYGGSELIRLVSGKHDPFCAICGRNCAYWTPDNLAKTLRGGRGSLYATVASIFDKPIICDSSKQIRHFIDLMKTDKNTELTFISIIKHPIRHIASYVTNDFLRRRGVSTARDIAHVCSTEWNDVFAFVIETAELLLKFYARLDQLKTSALKDRPIIPMKYESLVANPQGSLLPVLSQFGVEYQPAMLQYSDSEHHPIGGNMGPHSQAASRQAAPVSWGEVADYRKQFYVKSRGLVLDDKYRQTFSDAQVAEIERLDQVQQLLARLAYAGLS